MKRKSTRAYKDKVGYTCMNCGGPGNIAHHIVPLSKGGIDHPDNWMVLCKDCQDKEQVHKYADELELELATKKHYSELGPEIEKIPQAIIIGPQRMINLMHSRIRIEAPKPIIKEIEASTRPMNICPVCSKPFPIKKGKSFCSGSCRWDYHNQTRKDAIIEREIEHLESEGYEVKRKEGQGGGS